MQQPALLSGHRNTIFPAWDQLKIAPGDLKSGGDMKLLAGNNLTLQSNIAKTDHKTEAQTQTDSQYLSSDTPSTIQARTTQTDASTQQTLVGGHIDAGGAFTAIAGGHLDSDGTFTVNHSGHLDLTGVNLQAQGDATLTGQTVTLGVQTLQSGTTHDSSTTWSLAGDSPTTRSILPAIQNGQVDETRQTHQVGTTLKTGGDIKILATVPDGSAADAVAGINMTSAQLQGKNITLATAGNLVIDSAQDSQSSDLHNLSQTHLATQASVTTQASRIDGTTVTLAGGNIDVSATDIQSSGKTQIKATGNLILDANTDSQSSHTLDISHSSGWFSSKTTTDEHSQQNQTARVTTISGDSVALQAGADIGLKGSTVVGTHDVSLAATGNVTIDSAEESNQNFTLHQEKTSGLFGNGGLSVTLGSRSRTDTATGQGTTQYGSTVGSVQGNVDIQAGKTYTQTGSQVLAPGGNIAITGKQVTIQEARETQTFNYETKAEQSGLTFSVTSPVISAIQTVGQMRNAASNTSDSRMRDLAAANAALTGKNAYDAVQAGQGTTSRDANAADQVGGINISLSLGSSKNQSSTTQTGNTAAGSTVTAGGNTTLTATGAGKDSNLTIQGSTVKAGNNLTLQADNQINLLAAQNTSELHGSNSSSSASIGVGFALGGSQNGFTIQAGASQGRGKSEGSDLTWTNTEVQAGNNLTLQSGGDTTLKGAVASGKQVTADIGGNLNIESLQDTSKYDSKHESAGVGVSLCIPPFCYGASTGSLSLGQSKANGDYASVQEQSGIKAGDNGFQVNVKGNTDLKGAVIASTDKAVQDDKNSLTTASLTTSDIQNKAEASADSSGISLSTDMLTQGKYGVTKGFIGNALNSGEASGTSSGQTLSAVSGGAVVITDESAQLALTGKPAEQTVASLNRDTVNTQAAAQRQDVQGMERTAQAEQTIKNGAFVTVTKFTDEAYRTMMLDTNGGKVYKIPTGCKTQQCAIEVSPEELKQSQDGNVHIANNGIFNGLDAAIRLADQNAPVVNDANTGAPGKPQEQYLVFFPQANNDISELMVSVYQKTMEPTLGLSNATQANVNIINQYGGEGLVIDGHSRGAITTDNAMTTVLSNSGEGGATGLNVNFFGAAANAASADNTLFQLQDRANNTELPKINSVVHIDDFVGRIIGGNPATGGQSSANADGTPHNLISEWLNIFGGDFTAHNCYGTGPAGCAQYWPNNSLSGTSFPAMRP